MPTGQDLLRSATIILFASGIVAIGAEELYRKHRGGSFSRRAIAREHRMVEELSGPDVKARMSPDRAQKSVEGRREREAGTEASSTPTRDSLSRSDRKELDGLLDTLIK